MNQLADLGRVLALLRELHGFSRGECAARIGVTVERLVATEQGEFEPGDLGRIARLYALDEDELREGMLRPVEGVEGATIFLLQGAYPDFDARDLGVLERAMRAARSMTALAASSDEGRERLRQRLQFVPTSPAGPRPADAARQGHKLARLVRARLGLGAEPIEDIRVLLEEQLGIAVVVDRVVSQDLRATSIIDMHRAAAAAVIAHHHPDIEQNPLLARVYLAHELAHILFDPGAPGVVRLALDAARLDGASLGAASNLDGLLESRAKGFAAELLIPLEGVTALLGAPGVPESSLARARQMVAQVREHFGTPWDIAAYHLGNLGFIQKELPLGLRTDKQGFSGAQPVTSLPEVAATPVLLARMLATKRRRIFQVPMSPTTPSMSRRCAVRRRWLSTTSARLRSTPRTTRSGAGGTSRQWICSWSISTISSMRASSRLPAVRLRSSTRTDFRGECSPECSW